MHLKPIFYVLLMEADETEEDIDVSPVAAAQQRLNLLTPPVS